MKEFSLPYGSVILHRDDIAEVIIAEGADIHAELLKQGQAFLATHLSPPFSIVINKENSYSYDYNAVGAIDTMSDLHALAIIAYTPQSRVIVNTLLQHPRAQSLNASIFTNRDEAIAWVTQQQDQLNA